MSIYGNLLNLTYVTDKIIFPKSVGISSIGLIFNVELHGDIYVGSICRRYAVMIANSSQVVPPVPRESSVVATTNVEDALPGFRRLTHRVSIPVAAALSD